MKDTDFTTDHDPSYSTYSFSFILCLRVLVAEILLITHKKGSVKMKKVFIIILLIICLGSLDSFSADCIEGDCVNGQGTMVYATGHRRV